MCNELEKKSVRSNRPRKWVKFLLLGSGFGGPEFILSFVPGVSFSKFNKRKRFAREVFSFSSSLWSQVAEEIVELSSTTLVPSARHLPACQIGKRVKSTPGA